MLCLQSEFCINSSQFSLSFLLSFPPQHASSTNAHRDWVFASHITPAHLSRHSNIRHIVSTIFSGVAFRKLFARCPSFSRAGRCRYLRVLFCFIVRAARPLLTVCVRLPHSVTCRHIFPSALVWRHVCVTTSRVRDVAAIDWLLQVRTLAYSHPQLRNWQRIINAIVFIQIEMNW